MKDKPHPERKNIHIIKDIQNNSIARHRVSIEDIKMRSKGKGGGSGFPAAPQPHNPHPHRSPPLVRQEEEEEQRHCQSAPPLSLNPENTCSARTARGKKGP